MNEITKKLKKANFPFKQVETGNKTQSVRIKCEHIKKGKFKYLDKNTQKQAEETLQKLLLKRDLFEVEGSRKITDNDEFYEISVMVNKNAKQNRSEI